MWEMGLNIVISNTMEFFFKIHLLIWNNFIAFTSLSVDRCLEVRKWQMMFNVHSQWLFKFFLFMNKPIVLKVFPIVISNLFSQQRQFYWSFSLDDNNKSSVRENWFSTSKVTQDIQWSFVFILFGIA